MSTLRVWLPVLLVVSLSWPATAISQDAEAEAGAAAAQEAEPPPAQSTGGDALTDPAEEALDVRAAEVASRLRCPVCRNQSIVESNAELSREMHSVVRDKLAAGETPAEIEAYFVSRYGDWILLQPQARGINLLVYGLPLVVLILGFFLARNRLRKWASSGGAAGAGTTVDEAAELGVEDEQWLREALREG